MSSHGLSLWVSAVSLSPLLSLIGQPPLDSGPILIQDDLEILTLITYAKTLIQIKSQSEVPSGHIRWWPLFDSSQADITLITWIGKASLQEVKLSKSQKLLVKVPELEERGHSIPYLWGCSEARRFLATALAMRTSQVMCR